MWWQILLGVLAGLLLIYLVLLALLWGYARRHPDAVTLRDAMRLLPDLIRLVRRLAADRDLPSGIRVRLALLLIYLILPQTSCPTSSRSSDTPTTPSSSPSCSAPSRVEPAPTP
jgi:hypothetical protein